MDDLVVEDRARPFRDEAGGLDAWGGVDAAPLPLDSGELLSGGHLGLADLVRWGVEPAPQLLRCI